MSEVAQFLANWLKMRDRQPTFPSYTLARLLILVRSDSAFDEKVATTKFLKQLRGVINGAKEFTGPFGNECLTDVEFEKLLRETAFELRLLAISDMQNEKHLDMLRARLLCESEEIHSFRKIAKRAFSARHFQAFFRMSCNHFVDNIISPLNLVSASRSANPPPAEFASHLANFVECVPREHEDVISSAIASALYLDNFPPEMHGKSLNQLKLPGINMK
jgi:hypothetical protein